MMSELSAAIDALDVTLFDSVPAQSSPADRRALLALHGALAARNGRFTYLEIGSYLGGSLQALVRDPRCSCIVSIDSRPPSAPDARGGWCSYEENSTTHMLELLGRRRDASIDKIVTLDSGTESLTPSQLPQRPDLCFIDGEHTDQAALRDARFCNVAMRSAGVIAFHDSDLVWSAISQFLRENWCNVGATVAFPGSIFAIELGRRGLLAQPVVARALPSRWHRLIWGWASRSPSPRGVQFAWSGMRELGRLRRRWPG